MRTRRVAQCLPRLILAALLLGCAFVSKVTGQTRRAHAPGNKGVGALVGRVMQGPQPPSAGPGGVRAPGPIPGGSPVPLRGAKIVVSNLNGKEVQSAVTDDQGLFRIVLQPGTYRVHMARLAGNGITKDLPAKVTISKAKETHLDIHIDTGVR